MHALGPPALTNSMHYQGHLQTDIPFSVCLSASLATELVLQATAPFLSLCLRLAETNLSSQFDMVSHVLHPPLICVQVHAVFSHVPKASAQKPWQAVMPPTNLSMHTCVQAGCLCNANFAPQEQKNPCQFLRTKNA
jgi:hypothetical protein